MQATVNLATSTLLSVLTELNSDVYFAIRSLNDKNHSAHRCKSERTVNI